MPISINTRLKGKRRSWGFRSSASPGTYAPVEHTHEITDVQGLTVTVEAGEALGGNRAVYIATDGKAYYVNPDQTARITAGVTRGAASLGANVEVQLLGEMEESSWNWNDDGPIWLGASGSLTQTTPTSGMLLLMGVPLGPTGMKIEPQVVAQI